MAAKKERQLNYELLRIIAMLMIVCLHYLSKGKILGDPARADMGATGYTAWFIEAFCLVAVNVYVLISGYFSGGKKLQALTARAILQRPVRVWGQVITYSVLIGGIALLVGWQEFNIYQVFQYCFPLVTEHYWFATSYVVLCLLMPFLDAGIDRLQKQAFQGLLAGLLLIFSIAKTILPMQLPWDKGGYDAYWFVILYLTGAYSKRYGISLFSNRMRGLLVYLASELAIFASFVGLRFIFFRTGSFAAMLHYAYTYNHLLCYIGSIGLFMAFQETSQTQQRLEYYKKPIKYLSSATFGVYLLHEHANIRDKWYLLSDNGAVSTLTVPAFLVRLVLTVFLVYSVCTIIELLRQKVVTIIKGFLKNNVRECDY